MSTAFYVSYGALWVLVVVLAVLLLLVYRHFGMMTLGTMEGVQRDGLQVGEKAPSIYGVQPAGDERVWEPAGNRPSVLIFASPDCEPCSVVLPAANRLASMRRSDLDVLTIVPGPSESAARTAEQYKLDLDCLAEDGSGAFDKYRVRVTPFAFVVGGDGLIRAKGLCSDPMMLRDLLEAGGLPHGANAVSQPVHAGSNGSHHRVHPAERAE